MFIESIVGRKTGVRILMMMAAAVVVVAAAVVKMAVDVRARVGPLHIDPKGLMKEAFGDDARMIGKMSVCPNN